MSVLFTYNQSKDGADRLIREVQLEHPSFGVESFRFNSRNYNSEWRRLSSKLSQFGTPRVFIYNSGLRYYKEHLSDSEKEETMEVNYHCPIFLIEKIGERMVQDGIKGKIVLVGSILAGKHHPFLEDYCLSKGLLTKYVQENSAYWKAQGIEVSIISPNVTRTPMTEENMDLYESEVRQGKRSKIFSPKEVAEEIAVMCFS